VADFYAAPLAGNYAAIDNKGSKPVRLEQVAKLQPTHIRSNRSVEVRTRSHQILPEKSDLFRLPGSEMKWNLVACTPDFSAL
jgi:hypothetical protein